jgi:hypothetical protein
MRRLGGFNRILAEPTARCAKLQQLMIDAPHLKAHRTAASRLKKWDVPRRIGRTKGGLNSKLLAVCGWSRKTADPASERWRMSDYRGAERLPKGKDPFGIRGVMPTGFARRLRRAKSRPAFLPEPIARSPSRSIQRSIKNVTSSRISSLGQRAGGKFTPDTTATPTLTSQAFTSQQP